MAERRSGTTLARAVLRTQSDERLTALTREGHDAAYEEIVRRYRPRLVNQAARIVPAHRAEDVVQESLTRALDAMRSSDARLALGAWLGTIVRNRSLNDLRDEPGPHDELDHQYDGVSQPPMLAAQHQEVRDVVVAINSLPERQRRALVGRELEGLSYEQIAAELGVTPGGARGLIFRARAGVRNALGALIPLPLVRFLMEAGAAEATGGAAAGAGVAIAGAGGGLKVTAGVVAVLATIGSGVALERRLGDDGPRRAATAEASATVPSDRSSAESPPPAEPLGVDNSGPGGGTDARGDDSSGPGSGWRAPRGRQLGAGRRWRRGEEPEIDSSGPGGGGSSGPGGGDSSGSGSGSSDSGSGSSGSGSSGSGSSGSG